MAVLAGLGICSGIGGLELGVDLAMGGGYQCVGHVERDAFAAACLVARMEEQAMDPAPVWSDLFTFPAHLYRGKVDLITAGFPCQPFSSAGKRAGKLDDRWLWPAIAEYIAAIGPSYVFLENVPGLRRHGLGEILSDLAALGFDAEWGHYRADWLGAPHKRERFFLLAYADGEGPQGCGLRAPGGPIIAPEGGSMAHPDSDEVRQQPGGLNGPNGPEEGEPEPDGAEVADPGSLGWFAWTRPGQTEAPGVGGPRSGDEGEHLADPYETGRAEVGGEGQLDEGKWQEFWHDPDRRDGALPPFPPGPEDAWGWERYAGPQPSVLRGPAGTPPSVERGDRLRACGNAVVPVVAAFAFCDLARRIEGECG